MSTAGAVGLCSAPVALLGYLGAKCAPFSLLAVTALVELVGPFVAAMPLVVASGTSPGALIPVTWSESVGADASHGVGGRAAPLAPPAARLRRVVARGSPLPRVAM